MTGGTAVVTGGTVVTGALAAVEGFVAPAASAPTGVPSTQIAAAHAIRRGRVLWGSVTALMLGQTELGSRSRTASTAASSTRSGGADASITRKRAGSESARSS